MKKSIKFLIATLFIGTIFSNCANSKVPFSIENEAVLKYELSMPKPQTHYFEVNMTVSGVQKDSRFKNKNEIVVKMPVWTPGSYLIREYAKNVENFRAVSGDNSLKAVKINKNTWKIFTNGKNDISISYSVYAFELTVRTSFIDASHGYLNGASVFMYLPELTNDNAILKINPYKEWKKIATALEKVGDNEYKINSLDELIDSPIEIGNHEVLEFEALGIPHQIAMYSNVKLEYDKDKLIRDYRSVVENAASVVGEHPCKKYLFIIHHLPGIGGGLEHLNSTTCQTSPTAYATEKGYNGFFTLIAHEYFHLWNVKRIRPIVLGPFDYENENYTNMLWVAEGFTSFYEDDIVRRAKLISVDAYLETVANGINGIENVPGNKIQSAAESSWDAWIKYYRPNENSSNSTVSYYSKGGVIAALLNLAILDETKGAKSLDDVMKLLWNEYYKKQNRGYTDEEFRQACEKVAGVSLVDFYENYIYGTQSIPYQKYFDYAGLEFSDIKSSESKPFLGAVIRFKKVSSVYKNGPADLGGLNVNDEILSIDGLSLDDYESLLATKQIGQKILVKVLRSGQKLDINCELIRNPGVKYVLTRKPEMTKLQTSVYKAFVHED